MCRSHDDRVSSCSWCDDWEWIGGEQYAVVAELTPAIGSPTNERSGVVDSARVIAAGRHESRAGQDLGWCGEVIGCALPYLAGGVLTPAKRRAVCDAGTGVILASGDLLRRESADNRRRGGLRVANRSIADLAMVIVTPALHGAAID
jgi:hypothetical protein